MTNKEKLFKLNDMILEIELIQERARVMAEIIDQNYFDLTEDCFKIMYFDKACTEHDILFDYIFKNVSLLQEVRELLRQEEGDRPGRED